MLSDPSEALSQNFERKKTLNVVFSYGAYDMICQLLSANDSNEELLIFSGGFHLGPVGSNDRHTREQWLTDHIDCNFSQSSVRTVDDSHDAITSAIKSSGRIFAWVNLMSSGEYADFLYWVDQFKPSSFFIVQPKPHLNNDQAISLDFARDAARAVNSDELNEYATLWDRLKNENAAFRLFSPAGEFRSFTIDAFDDVLVASVAENWKPAPEVVLKAMNACLLVGRSIPGDLFFYRRLIRLSETLEIELRGKSEDFSKLDFRIKR